jgi:hypothetical protein
MSIIVIKIFPGKVTQVHISLEYDGLKAAVCLLLTTDAVLKLKSYTLFYQRRCTAMLELTFRFTIQPDRLFSKSSDELPYANLNVINSYQN